MASKKQFLITLSFLLVAESCKSSPVTSIEEKKPENPTPPENLCVLPPELGYSG
jgi:hypothetical protein